MSRPSRLTSVPLLHPLVVGVLFFVFTLLERFFVVRPEILAPVWIATGVLVFALLRAATWSTAAAITASAFLGSLFANRLTGVALGPSAAFSLTISVGGITGAALLRFKFGSLAPLDRIRNLGLLIVYGAGIANAVGAVFGAAVVVWFGLGRFGPTWVVWLLSNALGVLLVVPLASAWTDRRSPEQLGRRSRSLFEAAVIWLALTLAIVVAFGRNSAESNFVAPIVVFPLLVWVGLRFSFAGAALTSFAVTLLALLAGVRGLAASTASADVLHLRVIELQIFLITAVVSSLIPAAILAERRRAERALVESEQHLQFALRAAGAGSWSWQIGNKHVVLGPEGSRLLSLGFRPQFSEVVERIAPEHRARVAAEIQSCAEEAWDCATVFQIDLPNGSSRWLELKGQRIEHDGAIWVYGIVSDITQRKLAEEALLHRTSELESLLAYAPVGFVFFDREHRYLRVSDSLVTINGVPAEEHIGRTIREVLPVNAQLVDPILDEVFRTGRAVEREIAGETPKQPGVTRYWLTGFYPVFGSGPEPVAVGAYVVEITENKKAEQALRVSEERFRALAENVPQMVWVANDAIEFEYLSPKWLEYTGTTLEQNANGGWENCLHPEDVPRVRESWEIATRTHNIVESEYRLRRHDGEYRWHLARAVPIADAAGNRTLWFGTTTDIEDQKRSQQALIRSEKLAATGRLAASIAHEINNPLAGALNSLYLASMDDQLSPTTRGYLEVAQRELARVTHMTKQTLGFYREAGSPSKVDLRKVVDSVVELYAPRLKNKEIVVDRQYITDALVYAVEGEIRQVISNLFSNSIDAVSNGGCIRLRIAGPHLDPGRSNADRRQHRPAVCVTVSDNGSGIEPENLKKIFEPFFSTKEATGTGLGLWVTQQLVKKHEGKIRGRSTPGKGTVFQVILPVERRSEKRLATEMEAIA